MAIQKSFTDQFGATHTASYTRVFAVDITESSANLRVRIYHNAAARSKGVSLSEKPCLVERTERLEGSAFTTFFQDSVLDNDGVSPMKQAYAWLKTQNPFIEDTNWTTGTTDV